MAFVDADRATDWSRALISEFGSLSASLVAPVGLISRTLRSRAAATLIATAGKVMLQALREEAYSRPVISDSERLSRYLQFELGHARQEEVRGLYLDAGNMLIRDVLLSRGTLDEAPFYVREILRWAIELGATGLILVHNHPSGNPTPSAADRRATAEIFAACRMIRIVMHDHVIVGRNNFASMRKMGLL